MQLSQSFSIQILGFKVSGLRCTDRDINSRRGCLATSKRDKHFGWREVPHDLLYANSANFDSPPRFTSSVLYEFPLQKSLR